MLFELLSTPGKTDTVFPLLYGRFDLAGVIDGQSAKLIEFNADTATILPETVDIQVAQLKRAGLSEGQQFNFLFDHLKARLGRYQELYPEKSPSFLVTTLGHEEDNLNGDLLVDAAYKSGFDSQLEQLPDITFSPEEGIFVEVAPDEFLPFDFWFKLVPWEFIAMKEPALMDIITQLTLNEKAIILNPAYTMLFQSKGILKILWDLYPKTSPLVKNV